MKKNIWIISKYASPLKYGFASRHFYFAKEFNDLGYDTTVISSDSNHLVSFPKFKKRITIENIEGVRTIWLRTKKYKGANSIGRILSWIHFELNIRLLNKKKLPQPEVIIISSLSLLTILEGIRLKRKYKCKLIFEIRDIWPLTIIQLGGYSLNNPFVKLLQHIEKKGYEASDIIVGTMPNLAEHVTNVIGPNKKCYNIPQGLELSLFENPLPLEQNFIDQYIPKNKFIVGYAGSIGRSNALETIIDCALDLKENTNIHFAFLGGGDQLEDFKKKTEGLSNITFLPKVQKKQVQSVIQHFDVLYDSVKNINLYTYGLSRNKWIDYMYAAKPIIASYSGFPSMLNEAGCGTFIPAEDKAALKDIILHYASMSQDDRKEIGINGKKWLLQNRTFSKLALEYSKLF
ncbi:MAG: glycosyltransferase family 4 protein [Bacteroidetes bacterium]|nr:glycosyltransferase family 4 protein [Bacteroidota bacterium]